MGNPLVLNNTDKWLYEIVLMLRRSTGAIVNNTGNYSFISQFTVGVTSGAPANGETEYVNPNLTEAGTVKVHKNGTGYLTEGTNFDLIDGGGIELLGGAVFSNDETYTIFKKNN